MADDRPPAGSVFICYRTVDTGQSVNFIYPSLSKAFGPGAVFRDTDSISPGTDFRQVIQSHLRRCSVVLVFIGPNWLNIRNEAGIRLLEDVGDDVRIEIETALTISELRVIPVLVDKTPELNINALPASLRRLSSLEAIHIRTTSSEYAADLERLETSIRTALAAANAARSERQRLLEARRTEWASSGVSRVPEALGEPQWAALLSAMLHDRLALIVGPELCNAPGLELPLAGHMAVAVRLAEALHLETPPAGITRPLAALAVEHARSGGTEVAFARVLRQASKRTNPTEIASTPVAALGMIPELRVVITSLLDGSIESALAGRATPTVSVAFTPKRPVEIDDVAWPDGATLVFHAAGRPDGWLRSTAVTHTEWQRFSVALRDVARRSARLDQILHRDLLFLGGGHPSGFAQLWIELAGRSGARCWIGSNLLRDDPGLEESLARWKAHCVAFDEGDEHAFVSELALQRDAANHAVARAPLPAVTHGISQVLAGDSGVVGSQLEISAAFPGLRPFSEQDALDFRGREAEVNELLRAVQRQPVTVLCAASGLGKTSLLRAGLVPALRASGYTPIFVRLDYGSQAPPIDDQVMHAMRDATGVGEVYASGAVAAASLWTVFHDAPPRNAAGMPHTGRFVLLVDQLEEMFVPGGGSERRAQLQRDAWRELADLVEDRPPSAWLDALDSDPAASVSRDVADVSPAVVLSIREDFLARLEERSRDMPSLTGAVVRLGPLSGRGAMQVITGGGSPFTEAAAERLVRELGGAADPQRDRPLETLAIEPALLSLICAELDRRRVARGLRCVDESLLQELPASEFIKGFYRSAMRDVPEAARRWIEDHLVTSSGVRTSMPLEQAVEQLGSTAALDELARRRLLHMFSERGVGYVELVHDLLIMAVMESRQSRSATAPWLQRRLASSRWRYASHVAVTGLLVAAVFGAMFERSTAKQLEHERRSAVFRWVVAEARAADLAAEGGHVAQAAEWRARALQALQDEAKRAALPFEIERLRRALAGP